VHKTINKAGFKIRWFAHRASERGVEEERRGEFR
jgi:hypothetical protein